MKPLSQMTRVAPSAALWMLCAWLSAGCSTFSARLQSADTAEIEAPRFSYIGDWTVPFGTNPIEVSGVALVVDLDHTGSDAPPSVEREVLVNQMLQRGVDHPSKILADPRTSLVLVRGFLRPGIQKGERFDLEVRVPSQSQTVSLRGGWLMETALREQALLNGQIREGHPLAVAEGPVLIDPYADPTDPVAQNRGRILGGGVVLKSRPMGLVLKPSHQSITKSARVGELINQRFHVYHQGIQQGVATPKTNEFIQLDVHPRYKDNVFRYIQVVRAICTSETTTQRAARLDLLGKQLLDPATAALAALRLEAAGADGVARLKRGLESADATVRFYAAESLAYLNESEAAQPLADAALELPEHRVFALTALSAMDDGHAREALRRLLDAPSAETRYGAFRALWAMNNRDPLVQGEKLSGDFHYHLLHTDGQPLVHLTRSFRPEIVIFGADTAFKPPLLLDAGRQILVTAQPGATQVKVTRTGPREEDVDSRVVSLKVDDVLRAIVELGGRYPDVVQALQQAEATKALEARLEIDAVPQVPGVLDPLDGDGPESSRRRTLPDLFTGWWGNDDSSRPESDTDPVEEEAAETAAEKRGPLRRLFGVQ